MLPFGSGLASAVRIHRCLLRRPVVACIPQGLATGLSLIHESHVHTHHAALTSAFLGIAIGHGKRIHAAVILARTAGLDVVDSRGVVLAAIGVLLRVWRIGISVVGLRCGR